MADSLSLLRQYTIEGKPIEEREGHIIFGEFSWPSTALTNFIKYRFDPDNTFQIKHDIFLSFNKLVTHLEFIAKFMR
jgi:hypothetical protein